MSSSSHNDVSTPSIGLLEVFIATARDLRPPSLVVHLVKLHPYIKVILGSQSHATSTPTPSDRSSAASSSCPAWDEYATFPVTDSTRLMRIECWDRSRLVADSLIGYGVIELDAVLKADRCVTGWFALKHPSTGKEVGKVQLHLAFYPKDVAKQGRVHAPGLAMSPLCLASGSSSAAHNSRSTICVSSLASALTQLVHTPDDGGDSRKSRNQPSPSSQRPISVAAIYHDGHDRRASSTSTLFVHPVGEKSWSPQPLSAEGHVDRPMMRARNRSSICFDLDVEPEPQRASVPVMVAAQTLSVSEPFSTDESSSVSQQQPFGSARGAETQASLCARQPSPSTQSVSATSPTATCPTACVIETAEPAPEFFQLDDLFIVEEPVSRQRLEPAQHSETAALPPVVFPTTLRLADLASASLAASPPVPRIPGQHLG